MVFRRCRYGVQNSKTEGLDSGCFGFGGDRSNQTQGGLFQSCIGGASDVKEDPKEQAELQRARFMSSSYITTKSAKRGSSPQPSALEVLIYGRVPLRYPLK